MKKDSAARAVGRAMHWAGARGGWIYSADRQPLAAGWHALADRLEARAWIVHLGPGRGWEVDWPRVPAPGTVRPRADAQLEPIQGGPPHPGGSSPDTIPFPLRIRSARPADRWALVPVVHSSGNREHAAALAAIAAVQDAEEGLSFPRVRFTDAAEARQRAAEVSAATGRPWRAVQVGYADGIANQ